MQDLCNHHQHRPVEREAASEGPPWQEPDHHFSKWTNTWGSASKLPQAKASWTQVWILRHHGEMYFFASVWDVLTSTMENFEHTTSPIKICWLDWWKYKSGTKSFTLAIWCDTQPSHRYNITAESVYLSILKAFIGSFYTHFLISISWTFLCFVSDYMGSKQNIYI